MSKDVILFVNAVRPATFAALAEYESRTGRHFVPVVLVDEKIHTSISERNLQNAHSAKVTTIIADFDSPTSIRQALNPFMDRIFAVTSQYENSILELKKLVPYLPHLPMPTEKSLDWATEKKLMRELLESHDASLVPGYMEVTNSTLSTVYNIEESLTYPMIVKPSGLEGSLLVTRVDNRSELRRTLKRTLREMQNAYDKWIKRQAPTILVEEFMEGDMYSVDTYVAQDGTCRHTPPVKVVTGRKAGYDDFFGYMQTAPAGLTTEEIAAAHHTAEQACRALGLRSLTAHVELMKTADGWKIVELGPRIGGFRHDIYGQSYGINHIVNDILNRAGEMPEIPANVVKHTAFFNVYAREEGELERIEGLDQVKNLASFVTVNQNIQVNEQVLFAKNNGDPVLVVTLSHENEEQFIADVHALEQILHLHVKPLGLPDSYLGIVNGSQILQYLQDSSMPQVLAPPQPGPTR